MTRRRTSTSGWLNERGLRYIATAPGSLGLARAYVQGDLAIEGGDEANPYPLLKAAGGRVSLQRPSVRELPELAKCSAGRGSSRRSCPRRRARRSG